MGFGRVEHQSMNKQTNHASTEKKNTGSVELATTLQGAGVTLQIACSMDPRGRDGAVTYAESQKTHWKNPRISSFFLVGESL